jgi:hypothetical protein
MHLYTGREYFTELAKDIAMCSVGDRVLITSLAFAPDEPAVSQIFQQMLGACDRGASVQLGLDAYALLEFYGIGILGDIVSLRSRLRRGNRRYQRAIEALEELSRKQTGSYGIINMPKWPMSNLMAGRFHIKVTIVKNRVYIGGPNLKFCGRLDAVVCFEDQPTADWLYAMLGDVIRCGRSDMVLGSSDIRCAIDPITDILIDVGRPGSSLTMDMAVQIVDAAMEWLTVSCPFVPYGAMARHVSRVLSSGMDGEIYFDDPAKYGRSRWMHDLVMAESRRKHPQALFAHQVPANTPPMHAKTASNETTGMVTSQNFVPISITFGTPEIALVRRSPDFALGVRALIRRQAKEG